MNYHQSVKQIQHLIEEKLSHMFGVDVDNASYREVYEVVVHIVREMLAQGRSDFKKRADSTRPSGSITCAWNF